MCAEICVQESIRLKLEKLLSLEGDGLSSERDLLSSGSHAGDINHVPILLLEEMNQPAQKRRRGVVLTPKGLHKLQEAKSRVEGEQNLGNRYTLEALGDRTGLSVDTLMKVFSRETRVDRQTLKSCFSAFDLVLELDDYGLPEIPTESPQDLGEITLPPDLEPDLPGGQLPLNSNFYIERVPPGDALNLSIEANCYKAIAQPGALIRVKAPRRSGKTSLVVRTLHQAANLGYRTVSLNFQLAEKAVFQNLDRFLQWFCASVGLGLQLPNRLGDYWDSLFGSKVSCKIYFEQYLLVEMPTPIVLALDDVDQLFQYPDLADEFFGLLRTWHEEAKNQEIWKKLRLIVTHSTEVYIPLSTHKSPFNVGLPVDLPPFTVEQVQELARKYGFDWSDEPIQQLLDLVGGQPYLVQLALYHIWQHDIALEQMIISSLADDGIYTNHLQRQLWTLQQDQMLEKALDQILTTDNPIKLDLLQAVKLQGMGLVELRGKQVKPSCKLYAQYFRTHLQQP